MCPGAHSGEFTLWNGFTFNFETILQVRFVCGMVYRADELQHLIAIYFCSDCIDAGTRQSSEIYGVCGA